MNFILFSRRIASVANGVTSSALAIAAAALSSGQSANFPSGAQSAFSEDDLSWQTAFYHDDLHGRIHLMGKPQSADQSWRHQILNVATNTWGNLSGEMWNNVGHIYGNLTMDFVTGDVLQVRAVNNPAGADNPLRAAWWKYANQAWGYTTADIYAGGLEDIANGACVHPNLYGAGIPGLIWETQPRTLFQRLSNGAIQDTSHASAAYGEKEGAAVYWPAQDAVYIGGSGGNALLKVTPNGGGLPTSAAKAVPPISTGGHSHLQGAEFGSIHVHPGNPNKLLIVGTNSTNAWTSADGDNWTQIADHPFTEMPRVICSTRGGMGCAWAIGRNGSGHYSRLWKPPP